jgi:hypothetical protein
MDLKIYSSDSPLFKGGGGGIQAETIEGDREHRELSQRYNKGRHSSELLENISLDMYEDLGQPCPYK